MNHFEQLACDAEVAVYVMYNADASEIEFLNLKPMASDSERSSLAARWPGRDLRSAGVMGRLPNGKVEMVLKKPLSPAGLSALFNAFIAYCGAQPEPEYDWDARTYKQVPRTN